MASMRLIIVANFWWSSGAWGADVNNGGFEQYYFNSYGDQAKRVPSALRLIGAGQMAELVERANAVFGPEGPPEDRTTRQTQLEEIEEVAQSAWEPLEQEFWLYPDDIPGLLRLHLGQVRGAL